MRDLLRRTGKPWRMREHLDNRVLTSQELLQLLDGTPVVAGLVVRRQRPLGKAVYVTLGRRVRSLSLGGMAPGL